MNNFKTTALTVLSVFISTMLFSDSAVSIKSFFTENEVKLAVGGIFLTSVSLKGKGHVSSEGVEKTVPAQNSYIDTASSGYTMVGIEKGFFFLDGSNSNRNRIYRSLTDFSGLRGMSYFSQTQGENTALVLESYRIGSHDDYIKENIRDKSIPERAVRYFGIKDNRLGLLKFKSELVADSGNFIMINTLTESVSRFGMDIFYPGDYKIYKVLIYDGSRKGYFFYNVQFMKVRSGILNKIDLIKPESFGNRLRAEDVHFLKSIGIDRSDKLAAFR